MLYVFTLLVQNASAGEFFFPNSREFLCKVPDTIVIGKILSRKSYYLQNGYMDSKITVDIERTVKGSVTDPLSLVIGGGVIGDKISTDSWSPRAAPGSRYVLFLTTSGVANPVVSSYRRLDENGTLPSTTVLQQAFKDQCQEVL